jgi:GNAT superfamily N-acetyltransferase
MEIVKASSKDISTIQQLAYTIWPIAYKEIISEVQLNYMLALIYSNASLQTQIEKGHQFILAIDNDMPIGFASFSQKSTAEKEIYRLHKIYVLPKHPTKGVGSFLLSYICNACTEAGAKTLELNVNKYNSAKEFYLKKGFTVLKNEVIDIGEGYVMDDYVMTLAL